MGFGIGFDVGKEAHWVVVLDDDEGDVVLSRRVEASEADLEAALSDVAAFGDTNERVSGIDIVSGPATMLEAALLERSECLFYLPGTAVNEARKAYPGSEQKSDLGDAAAITDQLRFRPEVPLERHLPGALQLEDPRRVAAPDHPVGGLIVLGQGERVHLPAQPLRDRAGGLVEGGVGLEA